MHEKSNEAANDLVKDIAGLIPGADAVVGLLKHWRDAEARKRFDLFVNWAFGPYGLSAEELVRVKASDAVDYLMALINKMIQDDETAKAIVYGEAFRVIAGKKLTGKHFDEEFRWDFLTAIKELRTEELSTWAKLMDEGAKVARTVKEFLKDEPEPTQSLKFFERMQDFWKTTLQPGALMQKHLVSRLENLGLLQRNGDGLPLMPSPLADRLYEHLRGAIYTAQHESKKHKERMNFNPSTGQYDAQLQPPAEGWSRRELGLPEE